MLLCSFNVTVFFRESGNWMCFLQGYELPEMQRVTSWPASSKPGPDCKEHLT